MERLTSRNEDCVSVNGYGLYHLTMTEVVQMADRLAAYEDTGLTPEEIKAPFTEDTMINLAAQAMGVEADRLRELAEADKDGRVSVLPCKPRADMINKVLPGSTYLMERVHFAVAYVNKGNIYLMTQRTFEAGVKNGTIVSAATERAMEEKRKG